VTTQKEGGGTKKDRKTAISAREKVPQGEKDTKRHKKKVDEAATGDLLLASTVATIRGRRQKEQGRIAWAERRAIQNVDRQFAMA